MQNFNGFEVVYREMIEGQEGLFITGEPMSFQALDSLETGDEAYSMSHQAAAESWACWMRSRDYEVFELPWTIRTRDWDLTFSVTARGEDSRIFVICQEK